MVPGYSGRGYNVWFCKKKNTVNKEYWTRARYKGRKEKSQKQTTNSSYRPAKQNRPDNFPEQKKFRKLANLDLIVYSDSELGINTIEKPSIDLTVRANDPETKRAPSIGIKVGQVIWDYYVCTNVHARIHVMNCWDPKSVELFSLECPENCKDYLPGSNKLFGYPSVDGK